MQHIVRVLGVSIKAGYQCSAAFCKSDLLLQSVEHVTSVLPWLLRPLTQSVERESLLLHLRFTLQPFFLPQPTITVRIMQE